MFSIFSLKNSRKTCPLLPPKPSLSSFHRKLKVNGVNLFQSVKHWTMWNQLKCQSPRIQVIGNNLEHASVAVWFCVMLHMQILQVKEWLQNLGVGDQTTIVQDVNDEVDDVVVRSHQEVTVKNRYVPSSAALSTIRPTLGRQQSALGTAKVAMQGYLNHFMGNLDIVNSREVCKFLEVFKLSFALEYGPKLHEN